MADKRLTSFARGGVTSKQYLLVDGYNIIFSWSMLKKLAEESLENARDKLVEILSNYQGTSGFEIIVVFDAHKVAGGAGSMIDHGNLFSIYTKEAETADMYIERTTSVLAKDCLVKVATSDGLEQIIIMSKGALRVSASELEQDVSRTNQRIREQYTEKRPVKNNLLMDNLDKETVRWMEEMRRGK